MIDVVTTMIAPSHQALVAVLTYERRLLEELLYRHAEIDLLMEAGEHRFISRAIDEATQIESELGAAEVVRAATVEELANARGTEPHLTVIIDDAPPELATTLRRLHADLLRLTTDIEALRIRARKEAGRRSASVGQAIDRIRAVGYSSDGSPVGA